VWQRLQERCIVAPVGEIVLDHVTKEFANGVRAVNDVNLTIGEGEFMVLVGPSGCGKTTLLRSIGGLERITEGRILIGERDVTRSQPSERDLAMVFQNYALYPHMTVKKNLGYGLRVRKVPKQEREARVQDVAKMLGLEELLDRRPGQLSGGQQQRVAMGRAIVREPQAFLMDEPLSNLDAKLRVGMRTSLQQLHGRLGTTTVYVTHDQVEAMGLGDRIAVMNAGKVRQLGRPQEVYNDPADTFVAGFLGSPPMQFFENDGALVGFRAENLLPKAVYSTSEPLVSFWYRVTRVEDLGADRLLYGSLRDLSPDTKMIVNLPSTIHLSVTPGEAYEFACKANDLKFFDPKTGLRVPSRPLRSRA
jgi:multiple sugar transport system ATP-binding protein